MKKQKYLITLEIDHFSESDQEAYKSALNIALSERSIYGNNCQVAGLSKYTPEGLMKIDTDKIEVSKSELNHLFEDLTDIFNPVKNKKLLDEYEIKVNKKHGK